MTDRKIVQKLIARDMYSRELTRAQRLYKKTGSVIGTSIKAGAVAAAAGMAVLSVATYKAIKAANVQEDAEKTLATALGYRSKALLDQASALQKVTKYGDEQIIQAQALISSFVKDEEQVKAATKATLDLAAAKGMDLKSAADLVSKTLGSSTNALARYGIQVEGAVGSTKRLASLKTSINELFGGQAAAQAETFGGKIAQVSNAYGDLWEELGFVITRNEFFIKGLNIGKTVLENMSQRVRENRLYLMELAKSGILTFVNGVGKAVEVLRFFHNGWELVKIAGAGAAVVLADSMRLIFESLRLVLKPFDLLMDGLVYLGVIAANPFERMEAAIGTFQLSSRDVLNEQIDKTAQINARYDKWGNSVDRLKAGLEGIKITKEGVAAADKAAAALVLEQETDAAQKKREKREGAARGELGALGEVAGATPEDAFSKAWLGYEAQLQALNQYNQQKLLLMQAAGFSEAELVAENARMVIEHERKKRDFQLAAAGQMAGGMANILQNLMVATGSKNKAMFKAMKGFAIAEAIISTYTGAANAMKTVPYPFNFAASASVVAAGMAQVAKIKSQQPGGGGGQAISAGGTAAPTYGGGSATAYPVPQRMEQTQLPQHLTLIVHSLDPSQVNWDNLMEDNIVPALERFSGRNNTLYITVGDDFDSGSI